MKWHAAAAAPVLQQMRQLAVPERHVLLFGSQSVDDVGQRRERGVNGNLGGPIVTKFKWGIKGTRLGGLVQFL